METMHIDLIAEINEFDNQTLRELALELLDKINQGDSEENIKIRLKRKIDSLARGEVNENI